MTTKRDRTAPMSLKLDATERERLGALATSRKRSSHYLMREAVREYLTREEARESFRKDSADALRHYRRTGLHTTLEELDDWVNSLGTSKPKPPPKCHK
jgi:predicted transcriptional regulator